MKNNLNFMTPMKGAPWTPLQLSNLGVWVTAGKGVTKDGSNNVSTWTDQSPNGYAFNYNSTGTVVWTTSEINGQPGIVFAGGGALDNSVALLNGTTSSAFTLYLVVNSGANLAAAPIPLFVKDSSGRGYQLTFWNAANYKNLQFGSSTVYPSVRASADFASANTWYAPSLTYTGTGTSTGLLANYQFYISNVPTTTVGANASADTSSNTYLGNYRAGSSDQSGPIAEFIWQNSAGTSAERAAVQNYFNGKYLL